MTATGRHQAGVYTANDISASGFGLLGDGEQKLAIKYGGDTDHREAGMDQEPSQIIPIVAMEKSVANGFTQSAKVVKDNLSRGSELIPPRGMQMATEERGEIGSRLKTRHHDLPLRMQDPKRLSETVKWGWGEREG